MKILHIGLMVDGKGEGLCKALKDLSSEYLEIQQSDPELIEKAMGFDFDLFFMQAQSDKIGDSDTIQLLSPIAKRGFTINWTGDIRQTTPAWMLRMPANVTAFTNQRDVNFALSHGRRAEFLQIGIDAGIFTNEGEQINSKDIVFFANAYGNQFPLSGFRKLAAEIMKTNYGDKFGLYGNGFRNADGNYNVQGGDVKHWQGQEAAIYRGCKIAVSISHFDAERYTSDRLLRIMGCGAFPLVHKYKGMEKDFEIGKDLEVFRSYNELCDKIDYWLEQDRDKIKENAANLIRENYTYDSMAQNIVNML